MVLTIIVIGVLIFLAVWLLSSKGRIGEHRVAHILGRLSQDRYRIISQFGDKRLTHTKLSASRTVSLNPTTTPKSHAKSTSAMSAPTNNGATPPSPPANAPVAAAISSSDTAPTVPFTAASTTPVAATSSNNLSSLTHIPHHILAKHPLQFPISLDYPVFEPQKLLVHCQLIPHILLILSHRIEQIVAHQTPGTCSSYSQNNRKTASS